MGKYETRYDWLNELEGDKVRDMAACWLPYETPAEIDWVENGNVELLRLMIEDAVFESE